jgi:small-conductance mechanosensitive channel
LYYLQDWRVVLISSAGVIGAILVGLLAHYIVFTILGRISRRKPHEVVISFIKWARRPVRFIFPLIAVISVVPVLPLTSRFVHRTEHILGLVLIGCFAWFLTEMLKVVEDVVGSKYNAHVNTDVNARRVTTQVSVLRRVVAVLVAILAFAAMLVTFPSIWNIGAGLFASAGVAGLVIGMAAKPTLSSLLAGIQVALTQPIRLEDVVIVNGEWGHIEEIGVTFVVVRIWDLRRMVVPLTYFIENPFQNWTYCGADILGTVFVYTDFTVPVDEVRQELHRLLKSTDLWDGKVWVLQVTDCKNDVVELRALMSSADSGRSFDCRCYVRENLIKFLQEKYPHSLPKTRAELRPVEIHANGNSGAEAIGSSPAIAGKSFS